MITTSDLIGICSMYYAQANEHYCMAVYNSNQFAGKTIAALRCYMYALSTYLISEGVY